MVLAGEYPRITRVSTSTSGPSSSTAAATTTSGPVAVSTSRGWNTCTSTTRVPRASAQSRAVGTMTFDSAEPSIQTSNGPSRCTVGEHSGPTSTAGISSPRTTSSATLPKSAWPSAVRACVAMQTIGSLASSATARTASGTETLRTISTRAPCACTDVIAVSMRSVGIPPSNCAATEDNVGVESVRERLGYGEGALCVERAVEWDQQCLGHRVLLVVDSMMAVPERSPAGSKVTSPHRLAVRTSSPVRATPSRADSDSRHSICSGGRARGPQDPDRVSHRRGTDRPHHRSDRLRAARRRGHRRRRRG